jgi:hypothetical protein
MAEGSDAAGLLTLWWPGSRKVNRKEGAKDKIYLSRAPIDLLLPSFHHLPIMSSNYESINELTH